MKNNMKLHGEAGHDKNPHLLARREWDFQIGRSSRNLLVWRTIAIVSLFLLSFSTIYSYYHITRPKMVPYVVTVTQEGKVEYKGVIYNQKLTATDSVVRHYLIRFLKDIRTISSDIVVLKQQLADAYHIASPECQRQLTELITETRPFELAQNKTRRDIKITIFEKVAENTWRCEWVEYMRDGGVLTDKVPMSGTFSYITSYPETELEAENNPFGLYFIEFFITEVRI